MVLHAVDTLIAPGFTHYIIFVFSVCGIAWGMFNAMRVSTTSWTGFCSQTHYLRHGR